MRRRLRPFFTLVGKTFEPAKDMPQMEHLELRLSTGDTVRINVEDADAEIAALKARTGRFKDDFADLTGPALGVVRVDAIVAALLR